MTAFYSDQTVEHTRCIFWLQEYVIEIDEKKNEKQNQKEKEEEKRERFLLNWHNLNHNILLNIFVVSKFSI